MRDSWPSVPLFELCAAGRIITYGIVKVGDFVPDGVLVVRGGDIRDGRLHPDNERRVTPEVSNRFRRTILHGGELVINLIAEAGHVAIVPVTLAGANVSRDVAVIPLNDSVDHRFVMYYLKSPAGVRWLESRLQGSVTRKINLSTLNALPIPRPGLSVQRAIANILGSLDDKIELNLRMNQTLDEICRALFKFWFVEFGPVHAKKEGRWKKGESLPGMPANLWDLWPSKFQESEIGRIPTGWSVEPLLNSTSITRGVSYRSADLLETSKTALVSLKCAGRDGAFREDGLKPYHGDHKPAQVVEPGEIVVSHTDVTQRAEVIGRAYEVQPSAWFSTFVSSLDMAIVRPITPSQTREFLLYSLSDERFREHAYAYTNGTTVLHLSSLSLPEYPLLRPPSNLVARFSELVGPIRSLFGKHGLEASSLGSARDTLLPKLLSGETRIPVHGKSEGVAA